MAKPTFRGALRVQFEDSRRKNKASGAELQRIVFTRVERPFPRGAIPDLRHLAKQRDLREKERCEGSVVIASEGPFFFHGKVEGFKL